MRSVLASDSINRINIGCVWCFATLCILMAAAPFAAFAFPIFDAISLQLRSPYRDNVLQGINNSGHVIGYSIGDGGLSTTAVWDTSGNIQFKAGNEGVSINDSGAIVGIARAPDGRAGGFFQVADGTLEYLGGLVPGRYDSRPMQLNNSNIVIGVDAPSFKAFIWDQSGAMKDLGIPAMSGAYGINNLGQVVGQNNLGIPFVWDPVNGLSDIELPASAYNGFALDINDVGQVVGKYQTNAGFSLFLWDAANGIRTIGNPGGISPVAIHVNNFGQVAGVDGLGAFYWEEGLGRLDLMDLIVDNLNIELLTTAGINDAGQIAINGNDGRFEGDGFLLTPRNVGSVPEPSTMTLLIIGVVLLFSKKFRREMSVSK